MDKSPDAFRTISEAADELDLPQHVLRFWETRFSTIKPLKRGGGRRYYRPEDVLLLKGIRHLLYDQGFTIKGVQKILKDQGARARRCHRQWRGGRGAAAADIRRRDAADDQRSRSRRRAAATRTSPRRRRSPSPAKPASASAPCCAICSNASGCSSAPASSTYSSIRSGVPSGALSTPNASDRAPVMSAE